MNSKTTIWLVLLLLLNMLLITHSQKDSRRRTNRRRPTTETPAIEDTDYDFSPPQLGDSGSKSDKVSDNSDSSAGSGSKTQEKSAVEESGEEEEKKEASTPPPPRSRFFAPRGTRRPRPTAVRGGNRPRPTLPSFIRNPSAGRPRKPAATIPSEKSEDSAPSFTTTTTTTKPSRSRSHDQVTPTEATSSRRKTFGQGRKPNSRGSSRNSPSA